MPMLVVNNDPEFDDINKWDLLAAEITVTGGQMVWTAASGAVAGENGSDAYLQIGRTYVVTVNCISTDTPPVSAKVSVAGNVVWDSTIDGPGITTKTITATTTDRISVGSGSGPGTYNGVLEYVRVARRRMGNMNAAYNAQKERKARDNDSRKKRVLDSLFPKV